MSDSLSSIIGADARLDGTLTLEGSLRIDGSFKGLLICGGTLTIGPNGQLDGDLDADEVILGGKIAGTVVARRRMVLEESSTLTGDLATLKLLVSEGASFNGSCGMGENAVERLRGKLHKGNDLDRKLGVEVAAIVSKDKRQDERRTAQAG